MELKELVRVRHLARSGEARRLREAAGVSMSEIATIVGVGESTVHRWETGQSRPRGEHAAEYARVLADLAEATPVA